MMRKILFALAAAMLLLLCAPSLAWAGDGAYEVGLRAGVGGYSYFEDHPPARAVVGFEVCALCDRRYAAFGGYSHYFEPGGSTGYRSAELFNGGLRIQGRRPTSAFFDIGLAAGYSRFQGGSGILRSFSTVGAGFGVGVAIRSSKGLYIRPQFRLSAMSDAYLAVSGEVTVGWRF